MEFGISDPIYPVRIVTGEDDETIQRLLAHAWRVYLRFAPEETLRRLRSGLGWVSGRGSGISGFMLVEVQPLSIAFLTAAAISDDWRVPAYLDGFLPPVERAARSRGAAGLVQVGYAPWLTEGLVLRGFESRDWVATYEWHYQPVEVRGNLAIDVRPARPEDLATLLALDERIFGPLWHKPAMHLEVALGRAFLFSVAEQDGQIVGYQWCERHERHGHLTRLAVPPEWEGQGVGTRLLTEALVALVQAGVSWITLNTQQSNLRSQMLYERHGFRTTDDRVAVLWKDL
jgi:ribosomal-protein-alanine N-acetyltransferase